MLVGQYIRLRREEKEWTQKDLGDKAGLHSVSISRIEKQKQDDMLPLKTIRQIAYALNTTPGRLIDLADQFNPFEEMQNVNS